MANDHRTKAVPSRTYLLDADVDEVVAHYEKTLGTVKVRPLAKGGRINVADKHFGTGQFDIWSGFCQEGMDVSWQNAPDALVLYLTLNGKMQISSGRSDIISTSDALFAGDFSKCSRLIIGERRSHIGLAFDKKTVTSRLRALIEAPATKPLEFSGLTDVGSSEGARISTAVRQLWQDVHCADDKYLQSNSLKLHSEFVLTLLIETTTHNYSRIMRKSVSPAAPCHVLRAIDYMVENLSAPIGMDDITRECGIGTRALQLAFKHFKGVSPMEYLRNMRLAAVHAELTQIEGDETVAKVAGRFCFQHLGRFARYYQEAYGCAPSQTLRRSEKIVT